jgi:hypothetical protein
MRKPHETPGGGTNESKIVGISVLICAYGLGSYTDGQLYKGSCMETI